MSTCEHLLWIFASLLVLAIVAYRRETMAAPSTPPYRRRRSGSRRVLEDEPYQYTAEYMGTYAAPCQQQQQQRK